MAAEIEALADRLLKAEEVAVILGISRSMAYGLMEKRRIPVVKFGKLIRTPYVALMEWIADNTENVA